MVITCLDVLVEFQERREKQNLQLRMQPEQELFWLTKESTYWEVTQISRQQEMLYVL